MAQEPVRAQDNAQWIKTTLIDDSPEQNAAVERLAVQWAGHGMPQDGRLRDATTAIVNQAAAAHTQAWPADARSFTPQEIDRVVDLVIEDITEQAQFFRTEAVEPRRQEASHARAAAASEGGPAAQAEGRKERWPRVNFPNGFVHPFQRTGRDGRVWEMMRVSIPDGVTLNGIDLGGWQVDRFMDRYAKDDKLNGRPVTVSFRPGSPVELWRGAGQNRQTMSVENPWELCKAVKAQREAYAAAKAAEHAHEPQADADRDHPGPSRTDAIPDRSDLNDGVPRTFGGYRYEPLSGDPVTMHDPFAMERERARANVLDDIRQRAEQRTGQRAAAPSARTAPTQAHDRRR